MCAGERADRPVLERKRVLCKFHFSNVLEEVLPSGTLLVRERAENPLECWKILWIVGLWRLSVRSSRVLL